MIAPVKRRPRRKSHPVWHAAFLAMLPTIRTHARIAFRHLDPEAREEAVAEVIANACRAYVRLVGLGRANIAYAGVLARYGVAQVRDGRKVGSKSNVRDISSRYCQRRKGVTVERLDRFDKEEDSWQEVVVEDKTAGPADVAATRIDFASWLHTLCRRDRRIAETLSVGETTNDTARKFRLSPGRVSQLRRALLESWREFQGECAAA